MKRGGPLRRVTPLRARTSLRSTTRLRADTDKLWRRSAVKQRRTIDPIDPATRIEVRQRSGGCCEARLGDGCSGTAAHMHHRQLRRHGDHRAINLLDVCAWCHTVIHTNPAWSYDHGYLVRSDDDPASVLARRAR